MVTWKAKAGNRDFKPERVSPPLPREGCGQVEQGECKEAVQGKRAARQIEAGDVQDQAESRMNKATGAIAAVRVLRNTLSTGKPCTRQGSRGEGRDRSVTNFGEAIRRDAEKSYSNDLWGEEANVPSPTNDPGSASTGTMDKKWSQTLGSIPLGD
ncbi:MAG: hypothetical protein A2070_00775 [Bdellovibrionales bacterium GWC1_52_8]|nr:MAG: hypothetical protein A2070_00775 [Bdellovibrionales bacterium GWC1_52_8]